MRGVTSRDLGAFVLGFDLAILLVGPERMGLTWLGDLRYISALAIIGFGGILLLRGRLTP
jgi:hypothetical protein